LAWQGVGAFYALAALRGSAMLTLPSFPITFIYAHKNIKVNSYFS
jgi:hypothetical protein